MRITVRMQDRDVTFGVTTLCNHGDHGDYQATPLQVVAFDPATLETRLRDAGATRVAVHGRRVILEWRGALVTVFPSGRVLLERVVPDRQSHAAALFCEVMTASQEAH